MGWDYKGRQHYYYAARRVDGRPRRVYFGRGESAEEEAGRVERRRREREAGRAALCRERDEVAGADRLLAEFCALVGQLARAALHAADYHQHRGTWRRRRRARSDET